MVSIILFPTASHSILDFGLALSYFKYQLWVWCSISMTIPDFRRRSTVMLVRTKLVTPATKIGKLIGVALKGKRLMLENSSIVSTSVDTMGGTPVFAGTRVPIQTLLDYLKAGESIDDFLDGFPTVSKEQVIALLEEAGKQLVIATVA
jgi:uncharacterized protein (DUF433 family)